MELSHSELAVAHDLGEALLRFIKTLQLAAVSEESKQVKPENVPPAGHNQEETILLTVRQAAKALQISQRTLWGLTAPRGPIQSVKLGRIVRYPVNELQRFVSQP